MMLSVCSNKKDQEQAELRRAAQMVIAAWTYAHIGNEPMIEALVRLREALKS